jgi:hypothetical protein
MNNLLRLINRFRDLLSALMLARQTNGIIWGLIKKSKRHSAKSALHI